MKKAWRFILSNIDTLIAILVGFVATIMGVVGGNQFFLLAGIASTLTILSISLIHDRITREMLGSQIAELRKSLPDHPSATTFFRPVPELGPLIQNARQIDLCGVTLAGTIRRYYSHLQERLEAGAKIRILLIDPASPAAEMSALRGDNPKDTDYYPRRVENALTDLANLHRQTMGKEQKQPSRAGTISVRLLSYAPSFGMMNLDTPKKQGQIFVEIYTHKQGLHTQPTFGLTPEHDTVWHTYFAEQFEQMWTTALPWDPAPHIQKFQTAK